LQARRALESKIRFGIIGGLNPKEIAVAVQIISKR
jgi:hypothetical protein